MTDHIPNPPRPNPLSPTAQFMLNAAFHQHQQHDHLNSTPNDLPVPTPLSPASAIRTPEAARRPKPPSLKEQALNCLVDIEHGATPCPSDFDSIRRALEALPND